MKLFVKERAIALTDTFDILDENRRPIFKAKAQLISLGKKIRLMDKDNNEVATIQQKLVSFFPTYEISCKDFEGKIIRKTTMGHDTYFFNGPDWRIEGDFFNHEYRILSMHGPICEITRKWISLTDCYQIDFMKMRMEEIPAAICAALVIDLTLEDKEKEVKK